MPEKKGIAVLNFDNTYAEQKELAPYITRYYDFSKIGQSHLYCPECTQKKIKNELKNFSPCAATFLGSGDYHYATYFLLQNLKKPFTLLLFDHHSDTKYDHCVLNCGSWVAEALHLPLLKQLVCVGIGSQYLEYLPTNPQLPIHAFTPDQLKKQDFYRSFLQNITDESVYISVDKDVLSTKFAATNWDQGSLTLDQLTDLIKLVKQHADIVGVDICGEIPVGPKTFFDHEYRAQISKNQYANLRIYESVSL